MKSLYMIQIRPEVRGSATWSGSPMIWSQPGTVDVSELGDRTRILCLRNDPGDTASVIGARIGHALAFLEGETDRLPANVVGAGEAFGAVKP